MPQRRTSTKKAKVDKQTWPTLPSKLGVAKSDADFERFRKAYESGKYPGAPFYALNHFFTKLRLLPPLWVLDALNKAVPKVHQQMHAVAASRESGRGERETLVAEMEAMRAKYRKVTEAARRVAKMRGTPDDYKNLMRNYYRWRKKKVRQA